MEYSPDSSEKWTTFEMPLRESAVIPVPFDFARFVASSITFMTHLVDISVFVDDQRIIRISREADVPKSVPLPKTLNLLSPNSFMKVVGLNCKRDHPVFYASNVADRPFSCSDQS